MRNVVEVVALHATDGMRRHALGSVPPGLLVLVQRAERGANVTALLPNQHRHERVAAADDAPAPACVETATRAACVPRPAEWSSRPMPSVEEASEASTMECKVRGEPFAPLIKKGVACTSTLVIVTAG